MKKSNSKFHQKMVYFYYKYIRGENMIKVNYDKLQQELSQKLIRCPVCGQNNFIMDNNIVSPMNINDGNINIGKSLMPLVTVSCKHCGYTMFFNAKILGCLNEEQ